MWPRGPEFDTYGLRGFGRFGCGSYIHHTHTHKKKPCSKPLSSTSREASPLQMPVRNSRRTFRNTVHTLDMFFFFFLFLLFAVNSFHITLSVLSGRWQNISGSVSPALPREPVRVGLGSTQAAPRWPAAVCLPVCLKVLCVYRATGEGEWV